MKGVITMNEMDEMQSLKKELAQVSKIAYEFDNYKKNKAIRIRNIIILIISVLLILSNLAWFIYENSMETVTEITKTVTTTFEDVEQSTENGGNNNIVGGDFNGETKD